MRDGPLKNLHESITPPNPAELLWSYAYSISDRRQEQEAWLQERFELLSSQDSDHLNLHEQELRTQQEHEYHEGYASLQETIGDEEAATELLGKAEADKDVSDDEILAFIPQEFIDEEEARRVEAEEAKKEVHSGVLLGSFTSVFRPYHRPMRRTTARDDTASGRLTTGHNKTRLKAGPQGLPAILASHAFFDATIDTHGGKVRRPGKNGRTYSGKSGKSVRKR